MQQREQAARTFKGRHWRGSVLLLFPLCSKMSSGCVRCGVGRGALLLQNHKSFLLFLHLSKNIWKDSLFLFFIYWHKDESPKCYTGYKVKFISTGSKRSLHFLSVRGHDHCGLPKVAPTRIEEDSEQSRENEQTHSLPNDARRGNMKRRRMGGQTRVDSLRLL